MKKILFLAVALSVAQFAMAQDSDHIACLTNGEMSKLFQAKDTSRLPNYDESAGARVQRQHPNTLLIAQTKYINWDNKPVGICQYSNHVGIVSNFMLPGATADAADGACDDGSCKNGAYWRREWTQTLEKDDRPGREQIYVCVRNADGIDLPSADCMFHDR